MTASDVIAGGMDRYVDNVTAWAGKILETLRSSGNLTST
jgi:hypothetical protein